jgi:LysR family transcriptional regulator, glycine cleavage system transcriptional activator
MRTYIPLNSLRALECAARHLSFTRAASELCVTPTAISHQIRSLEEFLETPLFERKSGRLVLTPATSSALRELTEGFNKLESAFLALNRRGGRQKITVAVSPSVAALWLMPRLQRFFTSAPEIDVSISTVMAQGDFDDGLFDVSICNTDDHPSREVDYLMDEQIIPVCSPALLSHSGLRPEDALAELPLIHDDKASDQFPNWRRYFEATQSATRDVNSGLRFNQSSLAIEAAINGHGILLGRNRLIAAALADRRLVPISDRAYPIPCRYYTARQRGAESKPVRTFLDWLRAEVDVENGARLLESANHAAADASVRQDMRVAFRPDQRDVLADIDRRREEQLVGDQSRRVQTVLRRHRNAHHRPEILDVGGAAAQTRLATR